MAVQFEDITAAAERIRGSIVETPCPASIPLSEATGMNIFCKLEYLQRTGSFKERGDRSFRRQPCSRVSLSRAIAGHSCYDGDAAICAAHKGGKLPQAWRNSRP